MSRSLYQFFIWSAVICVLAVVGLTVPSAQAQSSSTGTITVTVTDPEGRTVPGAELTLQDLATNDVRRATTQDNGVYSFVNLSLGTYKLTVSKPGFESQVFEAVAVHATQVTDVPATLKVGVATETVEVRESESPLVETTSNAISSTIDMKQLEDLPINGRDVSQLAFLTPGYTGLPGNASGGTWNGLPVIAQGNNIDGVISSTSRMKFTGNQQPQLQARLEDMQEMTVQSDQLDLSTGFGQTDMQVNFVTRRGSNSFHGRVFDNFQNSSLNANTWSNDAIGQPKAVFHLNDFGGSLGGPILKNKLFFFGSYAELKQPGGYTATNQVLTSAAQMGLFTYTDNTGATVTQQLIGPGSPQPSATINPRIAQELSNINAAIPKGRLSPVPGDPNVENLSWFVQSPITQYFPAVRVDYNMSQNFRWNFAWNETKFNQPGTQAPFFPGSFYSNTEGNNKSNVYTTAIGFDWTIKPTLVNQFHGGYLYNWYGYVLGVKTPQVGDVSIAWNLPYSGFMSGDGDAGGTYGTVTTFYPLFNWSDNMTWQHGQHTFTYGISWYREQDHYWNPPAGINFVSLGLVPGDPAFNSISNALSNAQSGTPFQAEGEQLYAVLTGDVGASNGAADRIAFALNPNTKQYENSTAPFVLDELQKAWGLFFQDSWRVKTNLTVNYGLRWDFTGDDHDLKSAYESAGSDGVWGPSGVGNEFKPGTLAGNLNPLLRATGHQYKPWNVSPQPQIGIAWTPAYADGFLGKLTAGGQAVIRAGFSFRNYTEPYQFFWDAATNYGAFFYQNNQLIDNPNPQVTGEFAPGTLPLNGSMSSPGAPMSFPAYNNLTPNYTTTFPEAGLTFIQPYQQIYNPGIALGAINSNIKQPYTQSWNLSIQRPIGQNNAIELRYIGSRSVHQWLNLFTDEVNIFENGFLAQFKQAQANLAANTAAGNPNSFANAGLPGQAATPIFDQAFLGLAPNDPGGYGSSTFITWLQNGSAGAAATALAGGPDGNPTYYCNLVNLSQFPAGANPCNNVGYTGPGGPYPINFFQMNPYQSGQDVGYTTQAGYSNYNGLQVDFRQKQWHGMQFDVNYTWSHTLGINTQNSWTGVFNQYTIRNLRESYGPLPYDIRHSLHANGTYDLPFGIGKRFANQSHLLDRAVGGWSLGTIVTLQTGEPFQLLSAQYLNNAYSSTYNDFADPGVVLHNVSISQIQNSVGIYHVAPGSSGAYTFVDMINPKYLANNGTGGGVNSTYITPNITPGTIGAVPWLHGPRYFNQDLAITKVTPITERLRFTFQGEFLNIYNHPNFGQYYHGSPTPESANITGFGFGLGAIQNDPRAIELRANFEF